MKFKIETKEKEEVVFRNIRFLKELFDMINKEKGNVTYTRFVIEACKYALNNLDESNK